MRNDYRAKQSNHKSVTDNLLSTSFITPIRTTAFAVCMSLSLTACQQAEKSKGLDQGAESSKVQTVKNALTENDATTHDGVSWSLPSDPEAEKYLATCISDFDAAKTQFDLLETESNETENVSLLDDIDTLDIILDRLASYASLYRNVHPNAEVRQAADECQQKIVQLYNGISLSVPLYNRLTKVDASKLNKLDQRFLNDMLKSFKRSGVSLNEEGRNKVKQLNEEILLLGQAFNKNIREDVRTLTVKNPAHLAGLPQDYIDAHPANAEGEISLTTNYPDYFPFMQYAENDDVRREYYVLFRQRGYPANDKILKDLLVKRHELASLLGYSNYAGYITEIQMIGTAAKAQKFIDKVNVLAKPYSASEYQLLLNELKQSQPNATEVGDWQKTYLEEKVRAAKFNVNSQEIRKYFNYDAVRDGIFKMTENLFDVQIKPWDAEVWHESVNAYEMWSGEKLLGKFYLDMHPREGKYKHAAAFGVQDGVKGKQPPIVALVCNFPGGGEEPALMEHVQVETFLHEFGHLIHAIFGGHQPRIHFSGIKTERDFVEAPSQMLEEWVWDAETLKSFAKDAEGNTIPDSLIEKMRAGRNFGKALWSRHQMFYAATSLSFYNTDPTSLDLTETMAGLQAEYSPYDYVDDTHFHASFGHLYGYSAVYYTYMWSLVIAADMFAEFKEAGLNNKAVAQKYRDTVLAPGGSKDAAELVEDFLGRPYNFENFAKNLRGE